MAASVLMHQRVIAPTVEFTRIGLPAMVNLFALRRCLLQFTMMRMMVVMAQMGMMVMVTSKRAQCLIAVLPVP